MNKLVKGSIAGAAGIALLLGGAGTLAYWNDNATLAAGTITAGELDISSTAGSWSSDDHTTALPAGYLMVPGDTIYFDQTATVDASGTNLSFEITDNIASVVTSTITGALVTSTYKVTEAAAPSTVLTSYTGLTAGTYTVVATVKVVFPDTGATQLQSGQNGTLSLPAAAISVTQLP